MKRTDDQYDLMPISQTGRNRLCYDALRFVIPLLAFAMIHFSAVTALSIADNPYSGIVGRNTFALKPPPPPAGPVVPPAAPPPNVSLQGISTILGRAQALLKVKIAPKPPDAAKELSLVMDVGQREGDVEVLSIDPATGTVNLSNQGSPLTLNIKDADKPAAGPALPMPTAIPTIGSGVPGSANPLGARPMLGSAALPPPQPIPVAPSIPTRNLRTPVMASSESPPDPDVQAAMITVMAEKNKELINSGKMATPPNLTPPYQQRQKQ